MTAHKKHGVQKIVLRTLLMFLLLSSASAIGYLFRSMNLPEANIVIVYLLAVLMTAWLTRGFIYGVIASVIADFAFNYFFTQPYLTFSVSDPGYIITLVIMAITALITSTLTSHVKRGAALARQKETETKVVYDLTNQLIDARDIHHIAEIAVSAISSCFSCSAAILCYDVNAVPEQFFIQQAAPDKQIRRKTGVSAKTRYHMEESNPASGTGTEFIDWPVHGRDSILGVVRIPRQNASVMTDSQKRLLNSMIENTALAMDRFHASEQRIRAQEDAAQEHYRGNLLRAISHDLRTPLSGIIGTSEMLMDMTLSDDQRYSLADGIRKEADWLYSLVENILTLTRMHEGGLILNKKVEAAEEIIGEAVRHISKRAPEHEITVSVPAELLMIPMDAKLIEQVLINLIDNSVKHTLPENEISVAVTENTCNRMAVFSVRDRGTGFANADLPHIFQMFYTSRKNRADSSHGIGLGLAICESIIKAHGGSIEARNRTDGQGAVFTFTLPLEDGKNG